MPQAMIRVRGAPANQGWCWTAPWPWGGRRAAIVLPGFDCDELTDWRLAKMSMKSLAGVGTLEIGTSLCAYACRCRILALGRIRRR